MVLYSPKRHLFYAVILWNIITILNNCFVFSIFLNVIYSCDGKAELSAAITPFLSVTWGKYADLVLKKHVLLSLLKNCRSILVFFWNLGFFDEYNVQLRIKESICHDQKAHIIIKH